MGFSKCPTTDAEHSEKQFSINQKMVSKVTFNPVNATGCSGVRPAKMIVADHWVGGDVICKGKVVARVSYNGRVWMPA